jgi:hypothetical protein
VRANRRLASDESQKSVDLERFVQTLVLHRLEKPSRAFGESTARHEYHSLSLRWVDRANVLVKRGAIHPRQH